VPGITIQSSNCREKCKKQKRNYRYCAPLSPQEINSKVTKLVGELALEDVIVSLGGAEANRVVSQVAMALGLPATQFGVVGNHASTHVVSYSSWTSDEAQLAAGIKSAKALSNALWQAGLSAHQDCLLNALAGDPKVAYVQHGLDAHGELLNARPLLLHVIPLMICRRLTLLIVHARAGP
jgi:hypothetical protein